jgi:hypothetical protein
LKKIDNARGGNPGDIDDPFGLHGVGPAVGGVPEVDEAARPHND